MIKMEITDVTNKSHNPYFNRWFSAILICEYEPKKERLSQSLF